MKYEFLFVKAVVCALCEDSGPRGEIRDSEAGANTSACDTARREGWKIDQNSALCPECQEGRGRCPRS